MSTIDVDVVMTIGTLGFLAHFLVVYLIVGEILDHHNSKIYWSVSLIMLISITISGISLYVHIDPNMLSFFVGMGLGSFVHKLDLALELVKEEEEQNNR